MLSIGNKLVTEMKYRRLKVSSFSLLILKMFKNCAVLLSYSILQFSDNYKRSLFFFDYLKSFSKILIFFKIKSQIILKINIIIEKFKSRNNP